MKLDNKLNVRLKYIGMYKNTILGTLQNKDAYKTIHDAFNLELDNMIYRIESQIVINAKHTN